MGSLLWLNVVQSFAFSLAVIPSALLTLLRRQHFTSTRLPGPHQMPIYLQTFGLASYSLQAFVNAWLVAEAAWPRDEHGEVTGAREARRVLVLFCGSTVGAAALVFTSCRRYIRSAVAHSSPSRTLKTALRRLSDNMAVNRSPSAYSIGAVWPSIQRVSERILEAEKRDRPAQHRFFLTLAGLFAALTFLSFLSLLSTIRQHRRLSTLLTNRRRRNQLSTHTRAGSRSGAEGLGMLSPGVVRETRVSGEERERRGVAGRQGELRWTAAAALLSSLSNLLLTTTFLRFSGSGSHTTAAVLDSRAPAWVVTGATAVGFVGLVGRRVMG
ncbi:hypothetical protein JCM6882_006117 [Rhodosporidiobolus microsporus]